MQRVNKRLLNHYVYVLFVLLIPTNVWAQGQNGASYRQLPDFPFVFVSDSIVTTPPVICDSLFDSVARGVRFKVNSTELPQSDPFIKLYNDSLMPWLKRHNLILRGVMVKGAASPEGPYDNNVRLSRGRTKRLIDFLSCNLVQPITPCGTSAKCVTEDYAYLLTLMQRAGDAEYQQVKAIWDASKGDERLCKQRLMALNGGTTWQRLLHTYFPALRQSRMVMWYMKNPEHMPIPHYSLTATPEMWAVPGIAARLPLTAQTDTAAAKAYTRRHLIAIRTNLLHDFLYVPQFGFAPGINIQAEYYPLKGHYTLNAGFTFHNHRHWDTYKFFQMRDAQIELRRYFKGQGQFVGTYMGAYLEGAKYGIGFGPDKGWEGEGAGAGISMGHTMNLTRKGNLRLELSLSVGAFITRYDPYVYGNPMTGQRDGWYYYDYMGNTSKFKKRNHQFTWIGPTNAGLHITYDIIYRKRKEATR